MRRRFPVRAGSGGQVLWQAMFEANFGIRAQHQLSHGSAILIEAQAQPYLIPAHSLAKPIILYSSASGLTKRITRSRRFQRLTFDAGCPLKFP